jgi:hypothetical protein
VLLDLIRSATLDQSLLRIKKKHATAQTHSPPTTIPISFFMFVFAPFLCDDRILHHLQVNVKTAEQLKGSFQFLKMDLRF